MQYAGSGNLEGVEDDALTEILGWASPEQRMRGLSPEEILRGLPPEEVLRALPPEERVRGLSLDERLAGLSDEEAARLRELLEQRRAR